MTTTYANKKPINLPVYIQIPLFLYQDARLERPALLIAAFFYSIHTSGGKITASSDYLCALANINNRHFYNIMNLLEKCNYITRKGFTNRKKIEWVYCPSSSITVTESNASALQCTEVQELNTSALECTQLVHCSALDLCTPVHTDIKVDTKEYKKLTTVEENQSSSSFFSEKQKKDLLTFKLHNDSRTDEIFLSHCQLHIESQDNEFKKHQRIFGLKSLLVKHYESRDLFSARGHEEEKKKEEQRTTPPTQEEVKSYINCVPGYEWVREWMNVATG